MIRTSNQFIRYITGNLRRFIPYVEVPSYYSDLPIHTTYLEGSAQAEISRENQVCNNVLKQTYAWNTLEPDRTDASGQWVIYNNDVVGEFGWISEEMCYADGDFVDTPNFTLVFNEIQNFTTFHINFDYYGEEWATKFDVVFYNTRDEIVREIKVTNNNHYDWSMDGVAAGVVKVKIIIRTWNKEYRRAKVVEVSETAFLEFNDNEIDEIQLTDQISILESTFVSSDLKIVFNNVDGKFNLLNTNSLLHSAFSKKQKVTVSLFINGTTIYLGEKYIHTRDVAGAKCTIVLRDVMDFSTTVYRPEGFNKTHAYDLFEIMFRQAGVTDYYIAEELQFIEVNPIVNGLSFRDAIQQLANACGAYIRNGRRGEIFVEMLIKLQTHSGLEFTYDTQLDKPSLRQNDSYTAVEVTYSTFKSLVEDRNQVIINSESYPLVRDQEIYLDFGENIANGLATVTPATDFTLYVDGIRILANNNATYVVRVIGDILTESVNTNFVKDRNYHEVETKNDMEVTNGFLLTLEQSEQLGRNIIEYSKYISRVTLSESCRPDCETGDNVGIQTDEGIFNGIVVKQVINFNGSLRGKPEIIIRSDV